jgi:hypothetical protein
LSLFEGKTIDFEILRTKDGTQMPELVPGKIIRSGYGCRQTAIARPRLQGVPGRARFLGHIPNFTDRSF